MMALASNTRVMMVMVWVLVGVLYITTRHKAIKNKENVCPLCNGKKQVEDPMHWSNDITCFACNGTGISINNKEVRSK